MKQSTRRQVLTLCGSATAIGIAGCLGDGDDTETDDHNDDSGDDIDDTETGDDNDGSGDDTGTEDDGDDSGNGSVADLTLADTPHTGRYEFEVADLGIEQFVWEVQEIDGDEATVDVTSDLGSDFLEEETITVTPIIPDGFSDGRPLNEDLDIDELTSARFGDLWYPINDFANVDLSTLSVGDTWEETGGLNYEVTDTDSHAGLDCLVVERRIIDELDFEYCVSTEHAMILYSADFDETGEILHELTLTSYDG
ncbi:hypothetical protein [Natronococcus sp. A-GB7]|uniref:hypothetical protein n=1 Tax=Natronococcus sp. A-GB7 TaxID=3037649 RepID=UPI00241E6D48|nr:hypothetical protein [Natronococcus sp. A-GB7]MDG5820819.1 hypothetical protein [Natronococcus sp. A-GB7]